jgi:hypothetical protein
MELSNVLFNYNEANTETMAQKGTAFGTQIVLYCFFNY